MNFALLYKLSEKYFDIKMILNGNFCACIMIHLESH